MLLLLHTELSATERWLRAVAEDAVRISPPSLPLPPANMNGGPSVWAISPEERLKHDQKFDTLSPSMGFVSGEQARKFLLQSGLPASVWLKYGLWLT
ncbi:hypothetical protein CgunFtcFv8_020506 [Champsocephalus gunnari]|uniref:Uncharacterized protein n=1 Tax=Champsocephalus gunnari TaxID=52237 RepID=A0AAN8EBF3_CHAGU|nr:hypothetical protein CgunFtcFv8_020506 [Champsocephalus gunnari]